MSHDPNAKLRELRDLMALFAKNNHRCADLATGCHSHDEHRQRAYAFDRAAEEAGRMLAEPEPAKPAPCGFEWEGESKAIVRSCSKPSGHSGHHGDWRDARGVLATPRRETVDEEIARLFAPSEETP